MNPGLVPSLLRRLRRDPAADPPADAELVRRFAALRDEAAFEELLRRHGSLVWGVCRRRLPNRADAEDAFQSTFLVLAKRAGAIRRPEALGYWLYGVAHRVAGRMRGRSVRLTASPPCPAAPAPEAATVREFLAALDEELLKLPEKLRGPLVLCFLQERTQDEAARQLGVSLSTLKRRLNAGRELLRARLTRRGVELSAVLAAAGLAVPPPVADAAVRAAVGGLAAGAVSANVVTVTEGVVRAMGQTKLKTWAAGLLMATATAGGTGYFAYTGYGQGPGGGPGPGSDPAGAKAAESQPPATQPEKTFTADFKARPWQEVLDWFARESGLTQASSQKPTGTVTMSVRGKTLPEVIDLLNEALALQHLVLIRGERSFILHPAGEKLPTDRVRRVPPDELHKWGRTEIVMSFFPVTEAESLAKEVKKLLGPFGTVSALGNDTLIVIDNAQNVRTVRDVILGPKPAAVDPPELRRLRQEKLKVAQDMLKVVLARPRENQTTFHDAYAWSKRVMETEQEVDPSPAARVRAAKAHLDRMRQLEDHTAGPDVDPLVRGTVRLYRLEAEIWVREAQTPPASPRREGAAAPEVEKLRLELEQAKADAAKRQKQVEQLEERLKKLTEELLRKGNDPGMPLGLARPTVPEGFRGTVKRIEGTAKDLAAGKDVLVEFTPGLDAGVQPGAVLGIERRRKGEAAGYLGKITVTKVNAKDAVGKFEPALPFPLPDLVRRAPLPEPGDEVTTKVVRVW
jgi:RNA polymerase sigma factor (sigma-70 family)